MDQTQNNILGFTAFIISLLGAVYTAVNHKRIRSKCCGKNLEASLDVDNTTPVKGVAPIQPPT